MNSPQDTNASETGQKKPQPKGTPDMRPVATLTAKAVFGGAEHPLDKMTKNAKAIAETGRMEFPAISLIVTPTEKIMACDMARKSEDVQARIEWSESCSDGWKHVLIPLSTILRAHAMERALEDCQTPEDDSAFMDDNKGERARAHLHNINRIARHALKGTVTA